MRTDMREKADTSRYRVATLDLTSVVTLILMTLAVGVLPARAAPRVRRAPPVATDMNALGAENSRLARRVGAWDVVETVWASPGAAPTSHKWIAQRTMIGSFLQEIIRSAPASAAPDIQRVDYLSFHRIEGRWKYVSMDTRAPVGIMSAESFGRSAAGRIDITFQPFAIPATQQGSRTLGQLLQMKQLIIEQDADHDRKDQYFVPADGSGKAWLAHRYAYARRP